MAQFISSISIVFTVTISYYILILGVTPVQSYLAFEKTYDELYQEGMKAYSREGWKDTINLLEKAISEFKFYRYQLTSCRIKCNNISRVSFTNANELTELTFFESVFFQAECLRRCKFQNLGNRPETMNQEVTEKFLGRIPYSYLQFAYFKDFQYDKAMSAAYTYLQGNPQDDIMKSNLEYYESISASKEAFVDLEQELHQAHFRKGLDYYQAQNWTGVIYEMEESLKAYWVADLECRALCEGKYDDRDFLDLYEAISNHYASTLHCKEGCESVLANFEGAEYEKYLPQHFHFLQFAYFKVEDLINAAQNALTYLLFSPEDEVMKSNMRYYLHVGADDKQDIQPREDADLYYNQILMEKKMLAYARMKFWGEDGDMYDDPYEKPTVDEYMEEDDNNKEIEELIERGKELENARDKYSEDLDEEDDEDDEEDDNEKKEDNIKEESKENKADEKEKKSEDNKKDIGKEEDNVVVDISDKDSEDNGHFLGERPSQSPGEEKTGERTKNKQNGAVDDKNGGKEDAEKKVSSRKAKKLKKAAALLQGLKIVENGASLKGENRVVADSLTTVDECQMLMDLAQGHAYPGDGYEGNPHPHTENENFKGIDVLEVVLNARARKIPHSMAQAYLDLSERARAFTESYFNLTRPLYHSYTHLACRTTEPGAPADRQDLSHPVHADNCQLDEDGNCHKVPPAFVWRDWSAIMYLGDNFEGGEFIFSNNKLQVQSQVKPKCGRIVAFSAGKENLHGVLPVLSGRRCAMALWFTHDLRYMELNRYKAQKMLSNMLEEKNRKTEL
ncbi:prolyl 3-hydroxylase 1-like isoform X2 [Antedon mediterranea]|uniref:prolyl 3-hydroxylase 1-like isoform X2 n=1 Tax=Antedon mediterranea TaxID=105859 RepID=UPI003AF4D79D